jgi:hypothetical protein
MVTNPTTNDELKQSLKDIKTELDKAEQRDRMIMWVGLMSVGFGFLAGILATDRSNPIWLVGLGLFAFGFIGAYFRISPGWHYRKDS